MVQKLIRVTAFVLLAALLLSACAKTPENQAVTQRLTMYAGLGNNSAGYYTTLHDMILSATGVDVQLVFSNTMDTTTAVNIRIENGDLPADIVVTSSATEYSAQEKAFLDLSKYTNVPDLFTSTELHNVSKNGSVYQLPFTSRLIGIEYNKTLFEELGWELPNNLEEMLALKEKAEAAGYPIAVSGAAATGHGFNYLFHLMGTNTLCTPDGTEWYNNFLAGKTDISYFEEKSDYFRRYVDAGLFGIINNQDWQAGRRFCQVRALFYYNILNDAAHYDGYRYTEDGKIYGVSYGEDGLPVAEEKADGEAVFVNGSYVLYDENNEAHKGLTRYTLPGAVVLHDDYATMPWISENGSSNCFTVYHNMYLALDKRLGEDENKGLLDDAVKVMTYLTTKEATDFFSSHYADGFVATNDYQIDDSRLYAAFAGQIKSGYVIPWYYNDFNNDTIVNVGQLVNDYLLKKEGTSISGIMAALQEQWNNHLEDTPEVLCAISETLDYADSAKVQAISGAMSLTQKLAEAGIDEKPTVAIMAYTKAIADLPIDDKLPVVQEKLYAGNFTKSMVRYPVQTLTNTPVAVRLSGKEIKQLVQDGYNPKETFGLDQVFPYVCVCLGYAALEDDTEYVVSVCSGNLGTARYEALLAEGKVLTDASSAAISGSVEEGLALFMEENPVLSQDSIRWQ